MIWLQPPDTPASHATGSLMELLQDTPPPGYLLHFPSSGCLFYPYTHKFIYSLIQMSHFLVLGPRDVPMDETVMATCLRDYSLTGNCYTHFSQFPSVDILPLFSKCYLFFHVFPKHSSGVQFSYLLCASP